MIRFNINNQLSNIMINRNSKFLKEKIKRWKKQFQLKSSNKNIWVLTERLKLFLKHLLNIKKSRNNQVKAKPKKKIYLIDKFIAEKKKKKKLMKVGESPHQNNSLKDQFTSRNKNINLMNHTNLNLYKQLNLN